MHSISSLFASLNHRQCLVILSFILIQLLQLSDSRRRSFDVENLIAEPDFRAVRLKWAYTQSPDPAGFKIRFCEISGWNSRIRCREKRLKLPKSIQGSSRTQNGRKIASLDSIDGSKLGRAADPTNYDPNFSPFDPQPYNGIDRIHKIGPQVYEAFIYDLRMLTNYTFTVKPDYNEAAGGVGGPIPNGGRPLSAGVIPGLTHTGRFGTSHGAPGSVLPGQPQYGYNHHHRPWYNKWNLYGANNNDNNNDEFESAGKFVVVETKSFAAHTSLCLANVSEVVVNTGPYFNGKIAVEDSKDRRCAVYGNRTSPQQVYTLTIMHDVCGSNFINNTRIESMIMVHENREILTHNSRRFLVVCNFVPETFTLKASVAMPTNLIKRKKMQRPPGASRDSNWDYSGSLPRERLAPTNLPSEDEDESSPASSSQSTPERYSGSIPSTASTTASAPRTSVNHRESLSPSSKPQIERAFIDKNNEHNNKAQDNQPANDLADGAEESYKYRIKFGTNKPHNMRDSRMLTLDEHQGILDALIVKQGQAERNHGHILSSMLFIMAGLIACAVMLLWFVTSPRSSRKPKSAPTTPNKPNVGQTGHQNNLYSTASTISKASSKTHSMMAHSPPTNSFSSADNKRHLTQHFSEKQQQQPHHQENLETYFGYGMQRPQPGSNSLASTPMSIASIASMRSGTIDPNSSMALKTRSIQLATQSHSVSPITTLSPSPNSTVPTIKMIAINNSNLMVHQILSPAHHQQQQQKPLPPAPTSLQKQQQQHFDARICQQVMMAINSQGESQV